MTSAFAPGLKALQFTAMEKTRELPLKGEVIVAEGDIVNSDTVVLMADLPGNLNILRVAERLGIEPSEVAAGVARKGLKIDSKVAKGDIICEHSGLFGLFKSKYESPFAGRIEYISESNGHIGVREPATPLVVRAYIAGTVTKVVPHKSVTILGHGALVQGIFGVGGEKNGQLRMLNVSNDKELTISDIPSDCGQKILVGGMSPSIDVIKAAAKAGALGLVVGSIDDSALRQYLGYDLGVAITGDEDLPMTLIVTEGFGRLPMSPKISEVLGAYEGKLASINGATQVRAGAIRPEILVVHDDKRGAASQNHEGRGLEVGLKVRLIRVPYFGMYATITELPHESEVIESGAKTRILKAKLDNGSIVTVPRANVEIVS